MKVPTKLLGLALPIATIITLAALLAAGGVPQVGDLRDLIAYALELAPCTMYALAIGGSAAASMQFTGANLDNEYRRELTRAAAAGNLSAAHVIDMESLQWLAWTTLWACVYLQR